MFIKRYLVKSMPEAVEMIKTELGSDAVILSTHKVRAQGLAGLFGRMVYEVIAAIDEDKQERKSSYGGAIERQKTMLKNEQMVRNTGVGRNFNEMVATLAADTEVQIKEPSIDTPAEPKVRPWQPEKVITRNVAREYQVRSGIQEGTEVDESEKNPGQPQPPQVVSVNQQVHVTEDPVATELKELRSILTHFVIEGKDMGRSPDLKKLISLWTGTGMSQDLIETFITRVQSMQSSGSLTEQLSTVVRSFIVDSFKLSGPVRMIRPEDKYVALIGPTGVGKTTTIAKLAAHAKLKEDRAVGLLTVDTFRVAAVEQLRTYADILNIPIAIAESPHEVEVALENLQACDLVLVDTTGRSFLDQDQVQELKTFLAPIPIDLTYLVLSLTARPTEAIRVAELLRPLLYQGLLFTKADEAILPSLALSMIEHLKLPLSYISGGQHVPSDLFVAESQWFLNKFSGGGAGA